MAILLVSIALVAAAREPGRFLWLQCAGGALPLGWPILAISLDARGHLVNAAHGAALAAICAHALPLLTGSGHWSYAVLPFGFSVLALPVLGEIWRRTFRAAFTVAAPWDRVARAMAQLDADRVVRVIERREDELVVLLHGDLETPLRLARDLAPAATVGDHLLLTGPRAELEEDGYRGSAIGQSLSAEEATVLGLVLEPPSVRRRLRAGIAALSIASVGYAGLLYAVCRSFADVDPSEP